MSLGKYEREALERRRDELMRARATSGLSVGQGKEEGPRPTERGMREFPR